MSYACITHSFNYSTQINDSSYHFTTGSILRPVAFIHSGLASIYFHISLKDRSGKVGHRRAYQGHFVGYLFTLTVFTTYLHHNFIILEVLETGKYSQLRHSIGFVKFDISTNFLRPNPDTFASDGDIFPHASFT